ncbi:hypothetical protein GO986_21470 [Deinococcus sp. HMF7620]|uniref:Uncharacterized protein n=1 Tax=Deinococcus arboris TaxID=2682977 RepID=A0A7C9HUD6_9DEIO|nr:hypothetical protein [Deinococcus arboris]MVN89309.1 hypothetical protein [Deinococcus arboris]
MSPTDRFVREATRGLWGQRRRDALTELRGAVEDKVYRYRLCGLDQTQAEQAALRDLGSPHAIARDLSRVHTAPLALRATLALGIAGLLSFQAVAVVPGVQAILDPRMQPACTLDELYVRLVPGATPATAQRLLTTPAGQQQLQTSVLGRLAPEHAEYLRRQLSQPGGMAAAVATCRELTPAYAANLLKLDDVYQALRAAGVTVTPLHGAGLVQLSFPGEEPRQTVNLEHSLQTIGGVQYVAGSGLLNILKSSVTARITLTGLRNPTLTIGPATLRLGTEDHPVLTTDLLSYVMLDWLSPQLPKLPGTMTPAISGTLGTLTPDPAGHHVRVNAPDGALYATLSNAAVLGQSGQSQTAVRAYSLALGAVTGGLLPAPLAEGREVGFARLVSTLPELFAATKKNERALLVYRLSGTDLRQLTYTPVPAAQLRPNTAP